MTEIALGVVMFTAIVLALVALILVAARALVRLPATSTITINGEREAVMSRRAASC